MKYAACLWMLMGGMLIAPSARAGLLYEYDARDLALGPVTAWNDTIGTATNARNWSFQPLPTVATGDPVFTQAMQFDGTLTPAATSNPLTDTYGNSDFTSGTGGRNAAFEVWFQPDSLGEGVLFETGGTNSGLALWMQSDGTLAFSTSGGGNNSDVVSGITPSLSAFTQVVGVVDEAANRTRLFIDGVEVGTGTVGTQDWTAGTNPAALAASSSINPPANSSIVSFAGDIALVRVYNDTLSPTEIADIYASTIPEPASLALLGLGGLLAVRRQRK